MHKILDLLYQGDWNNAVQTSKYEGMDMIVYLGQEMGRELSHESKVPVIHYPLKDGKNPQTKLDILLETIGLLQIHSLKTLVACRLGLSRSPMIVVAFLSNALGFDKAFRFVRKEIPEMLPAPELYSQIERMFK